MLHGDKFCPECASSLEVMEVAAACIVERNGMVLLVRRAIQPGLGLWSMPGGYVDRGEVVEEAAAREVLEETGLEVEVEHLVGLFSEKEHPVMVAAYAARETGGSLKAGAETLELAFFPLGGLPPLAFPRDKQILDRWLELQDGRQGAK